MTSGQTTSVTSAAEATYVVDGGTLLVVSGGVSTGTVVSSGTEVLASGKAVGTEVNGFSVPYGATVSGFSGSAYQIIADGGLALGTVLDGNGVAQVVESGGVASGTLLSGLLVTQIVSSGGVVSGTVFGVGGFASWAWLQIAGGRAVESAGDVMSDSYNYPAGGVIDFSAPGGTLEVVGTRMPEVQLLGFDANGPTDANAIDLASVPFDANGSASFDSRNQVVFGSFSFYTPSHNLTVTEGGIVVSIDLMERYGMMPVLSDDGSGGTLVTFAPTSVAVVSGQTETLASSASDLVVFAGGTLQVASGGSAVRTSVSGGAVSVATGGVASQTVILSGSEVVFGGTAIRTDIFASGVQVVASNGVASATTLDSPGATQIVSVGGTAIGAVLSAFSTTQIVSSGGVAIGTVLSGSLTRQIVSSGGVAIGTILNGEANPFHSFKSLVIDGGTAVISGADVPPAGDIGFGPLGNGVVIVLASDVAFSADIGFGPSGGGTLEITGTLMPDITIFGYDVGLVSASDVIDLASVPFDSRGSATLLDGNTLEISEGGSTYALAFDPAQTFVGRAADLADDGHGGTRITWPPAPFGTAASVACFAAGTRIRSEHGEQPVESLQVDDVLLGPWGNTMAVRWLGHRDVDCRRTATWTAVATRRRPTSGRCVCAPARFVPACRRATCCSRPTMQSSSRRPAWRRC